MGKAWGAATVAAIALFAGPCFAEKPAGQLKPIPDKPETEQFKDVPAPWRDYLVRARAAERIEDPLQRCLAYPDLPGNRWPAGHAEAHCRYHHGTKVIGLDDIDDQLRSGGVKGLERLMDAYLDKHFSKTEPGEDIHLVFEKFESTGDDADRVSARWLELAPRSAYANLARGTYLRNAAWDARGGKWAADTPDGNMRRMEALMAEAIPLHQEAARIEPRLMPAYSGLINMAKSGSHPGLERKIVAEASRHDPACLEMARQRMVALQPRWGGSYEEMLSFAAELSPYVDRRPQLAIHVAAPYGDRGNRMVAEDEYTKEAADILDIAVRIGSNELHMHDAGTVAINLPKEHGGAQPWKGLSMFLQESRFNGVSTWTDRQIAWRLVRFEPEWSLRHSMRALESDPDDSFGQYVLAAGLNNTRQYEAAEHHYSAAADHAGQRRAALREVAGMLLYRADPDRKAGALRAGPYIDRLLREYPEDGRGWLLRIDQRGVLDGKIDMKFIRSFLAHADRDDPWLAERAEKLEAELVRGKVPPELWKP